MIFFWHYTFHSHHSHDGEGATRGRKFLLKLQHDAVPSQPLTMRFLARASGTPHCLGPLACRYGPLSPSPPYTIHANTALIIAGFDSVRNAYLRSRLYFIEAALGHFSDAMLMR